MFLLRKEKPKHCLKKNNTKFYFSILNINSTIFRNKRSNLTKWHLNWNLKTRLRNNKDWFIRKLKNRYRTDFSILKFYIKKASTYLHIDHKTKYVLEIWSALMPPSMSIRKWLKLYQWISSRLRYKRRKIKSSKSKINFLVNNTRLKNIIFK